jgi:hypothetical protein
MSDTNANEHQNTPNSNDLEALMAADEAARSQPETDPAAPTGDDPEAPKPPDEGLAPSEDETAKPTPKTPENEAETDLNKRNARLFHEKRAAERQAKSLREQLARLQGTSPPDPDADAQHRIEERAAQIATERGYNDRANAIYNQGIKEFPDFEQSLAGFRDLGGVSPALVEAAEEAGDAHKIIHYLAKNLDEAERVINLKPHQMGAALSKIGAKLSAVPPPKPQSKAPPPIKMVAGRGGGPVDDAHMSIDEYMKREDAKYQRVRR